jgi:citronellol/citronellal dehydrogenase
MTEPIAQGLAEPAYDYSDEALMAERTALASNLLNGQRVLVTGGGSGIGRVIAWLAGRLGGEVLIYGRKAAKVEAVAAAMTAHGLSCKAGVLDIRDRDTVDRVMTDVFVGGGLDILINNAGGHFPSPAIDLSQKGWTAVIENNLTGSFNMMQAAARGWRDAGGGGSIATIVIAMRGIHNLAHSLASRAGVIAFTQAVSAEWAEYGIRANCVAPGSVITEIWGEKERAIYTQGNPTRRAGTIWEIAESTLFLASRASGFTNGQVLTVDGGMSQWGESWSCGKPDHLRAASAVWQGENDLLERWRR